jgi:hypothetical protein
VSSVSRQHKATGALQRVAEAAANPRRSKRGSRAEQSRAACVDPAGEASPSIPPSQQNGRARGTAQEAKRGVHSRARPRRGRSCARTWRRGGGSRTRSRVWAPGAGQGEAAAESGSPAIGGVAEVAAVDRAAGWRGVGARAGGGEREREREREREGERGARRGVGVGLGRAGSTHTVREREARERERETKVEKQESRASTAERRGTE